MTTYAKLKALRQLAECGLGSDKIEDVVLDTIKKVVAEGDAPQPPTDNGPLRNCMAVGHARFDALTSHFEQASLSELDAYQKHGRIAALKAYRARTGLGLKDAMDCIDESARVLGLCKSDEKHPLATENDRLKKLVADLYDAEERRIACLDLHDEHHRAWADAIVVARQYEGSKMPF